jgi:hypothetical protein
MSGVIRKHFIYTFNGSDSRLGGFAPLAIQSRGGLTPICEGKNNASYFEF